MFGTPNWNPNSVIQIQNHWVPRKKKTCLVRNFQVKIEIPTWILCGSHVKFEFSHLPVFESNLDSNPNSIYVGPSFITVTGPTRFFFLPIFSLSPPFASLLLSPLLSGISRPLHRRRQTKKYPTKQKQTEMQETILSVLSNKKKSVEGKEEELWGLRSKKKKGRKKERNGGRTGLSKKKKKGRRKERNGGRIGLSKKKKKGRRKERNGGGGMNVW